MKNNDEEIKKRQIASEYYAVQKKLDRANETLKPFTEKQIREAFDKARSQRETTA